MATYVDSFARADVSPLGGDWGIETGSGFQIVNNAIKSVIFSGEVISSLSALPFTDDQSAEITIADHTSFDFLGIGVRFDGSGNGYVLAPSGGTQLSIFRFDSGVGTSLATITSTPVASTDTLELSIVGDSITAKLNDVIVGTVTDATHSSGSPAIYYFRNDSNATTGINFSAEGHIVVAPNETVTSSPITLTAQAGWTNVPLVNPTTGLESILNGYTGNQPVTGSACEHETVANLTITETGEWVWNPAPTTTQTVARRVILADGTVGATEVATFEVVEDVILPDFPITVEPPTGKDAATMTTVSSESPLNGVVDTNDIVILDLVSSPGGYEAAMNNRGIITLSETGGDQATQTVNWYWLDASDDYSSQTGGVYSISLDTTAPVITLIGDNSINVYQGSTYVDQGATWSDNIDGSGSITATGSVDTNTIDSYILSYDYTDQNGNDAITVTRTVNVVAVDSVNLAPIANDASFTILSNISNGDVIGTYSSASDPDGSIRGYSTTSSIIDIDDAGVVTMIDNSSVTVGVDLVEQITAIDDSDVLYYTKPSSGNSSLNINIDQSSFSGFRGILRVTMVTANDLTGNSEMNITIGDGGSGFTTYFIPNEASEDSGNGIGILATPSVDLGGGLVRYEIDIDLSTLSNDMNYFGLYQNFDQYSFNIENIEAVGFGTPLDFNETNWVATGNGTIQWNLVDTANLTISVNSFDSTLPIIQLLGDSTVTIVEGTTYVDAGATASDNVDGNITNNITTSNNVNVNVPNTYTVTYNVSDSNGNAAVQVSRTVIVESIDTTPAFIAPQTKLNQQLLATVIFDPIQITDINSPVTAILDSGESRVSNDGSTYGSYSTSNKVLSNGDWIQVRSNASAINNTPKVSTLSINTTDITFTSITIASGSVDNSLLADVDNVTKRSEKTSPLTQAELDRNFQELRYTIMDTTTLLARIEALESIIENL